MKLDEILAHWKNDAALDPSELGNDAAKAPDLHHKYLAWQMEEELRLKFMKSKFKRLKLKKWEFYQQGPSKETRDLGWEIPSIGKILNQNIPMYLDGDKELAEEQLKIDMVEAKLKALESIISQINNRSFLIGHCLSDLKWKGGN